MHGVGGVSGWWLVTACLIGPCVADEDTKAKRPDRVSSRGKQLFNRTHTVGFDRISIAAGWVSIETTMGRLPWLCLDAFCVQQRQKSSSLISRSNSDMIAVGGGRQARLLQTHIG